jgi:hypothetical protein
LNVAAAYVDAVGASLQLRSDVAKLNCHYGCGINDCGGIQTKRLCPASGGEEERILAASPYEKLSADVILSFPPR